MYLGNFDFSWYSCFLSPETTIMWMTGNHTDMLAFFFFFLPLGVVKVDHLPSSHPILTSFSITSTLCMPSFTISMNLLWGLPLFLLVCSSIFGILCPVYRLSLLCTCSNCLSSAALIFSLVCSTWAVPLIYSFLTCPFWSLPIKMIPVQGHY